MSIQQEGVADSPQTLEARDPHGSLKDSPAAVLHLLSQETPATSRSVTEDMNMGDDDSDMDVSPPGSPQQEAINMDTEDDDELYGNAPPQTSSRPSPSPSHQDQPISTPLVNDDDSIPGLTISARVRGPAPAPSSSVTDSHLDGSTLAVSPRSPTVLTPDIEPLKAKPMSWALQQSGPEDASATLPAPEIKHDEAESVQDPSTTEVADVDTNTTPDEDVVPVEEPLSETLRVVVMMRLQCDHQPREARVDPVLLANRSVVEPESLRQSSSPDELLREINEKMHLEATRAAIKRTQSSLEERFKERQVALSDKVQRLKEEYLTLHRRWMTHCAKLDEVVKANALEEAAATAGRTTRRSNTGLGDAVRSDLEMEQIIASLGNEEMTDANHLALRNVADIPDMISVTQSKVDYVYDDTNNLVGDPIEFYAPRTGIDDWTEEEKAIFLTKFAETPKQFGLIADALPDKTAAQCVLYYYLHKKTLIDFRKVVARQQVGKRRRGGGRRGDKQKGNALLADIRKRDDEVSREGPTTRRRRAVPQASSVVVTAPEPRRGTASRRAAAQREPTETPSATPDPEPELKRRRRRVAPSARAAVTEEQGEGEEDAEVSSL